MQNLPAITATLNTTATQNDRFRTPARTRERRTCTSLPPPDQRSWLLLTEAANLIGCSKATADRLRRGEIDGVPRLPALQVAKRKWVVLKASLEQWQQENERISAARYRQIESAKRFRDARKECVDEQKTKNGRYQHGSLCESPDGKR